MNIQIADYEDYLNLTEPEHDHQQDLDDEEQQQRYLEIQYEERYYQEVEER